MKAIVQARYGPPLDTLALREVGEPVVDDDDVLVRVHAAAVNPADWHLIRGDPYGRIVAVEDYARRDEALAAAGATPPRWR